MHPNIRFFQNRFNIKIKFVILYMIDFQLIMRRIQLNF